MITSKIITMIPNLISVSTIGGEASEENVGENAEAPDVGRQADRLVGQDFRSWGYRDFKYLSIKSFLLNGLQSKM